MKINGKINGLIFTALLALMAGGPLAVSAQNQAPSDGVVNCSGITDCTWDKLVGAGGLIHNIIYFLLFGLAMPVAVIALVVAGVMLVTKPAVPESRTRAKKIIWSVIFGLILALAAYLIIQTIITGLGGSEPLQGVFQ